jgi:RimJ/RimL family protein N-acetyltransferase
MEYIIFREGYKVALAIVTLEHLPLFLKWLNDPEITKYLGRNFPLLELAEKEYLETLHTKSEKHLVFLVLAKNADGSWKPIGSMGLHHMDLFQKTATTGAVIGESEYLSGGYGSEAKLLLLRYAFDWLNMRIILSKVYGSNGRSLAYSERCGYKVVGRIPKYRWHAGCYEDEITMAVTRERFEVIWSFYQENQRAPRREELAKLFENKN